MQKRTISVQMYTVREALAQDQRATLKRLKEIGFDNVEAFNFVAQPQQLSQDLSDFSLRAPSGHAQLLEQNLEDIARAAEQLGIETLIYPWMNPAVWQTPESVVALAKNLNRAADYLMSQGFTVGYHNHWFELENEIDGRPAIEAFSQMVHKEIVFEIDTYWVQVAGTNPVTLLEFLGDRVTHLHLKDGPAVMDPSEQLPLGSGVLDVPAIIAAAPNATLVLELDEYRGDMFDALDRGLRYLRSLDIGS